MRDNVSAPAIKVIEIDSLDSLEEILVEVSFNSSVILGIYDYFILVDYENELRESDKLNNVKSFSIEVVLQEICGNEFDDDVDGYVDEGCEEQCYNGLDDDLDGKVDEGCSEICFNSIDDDNNGLIDDGCINVPDEIPNNDIDDDKDGFVDEGFVEVCLDNKDNDEDGKVDEGCEWTKAIISGEALQINVENEVNIGEFQTIQVTHSIIGIVANALVVITSPSGKMVFLETDGEGRAEYLVEEEGIYTVKGFIYALTANARFNGLGLAVRAGRTALSLPTILFGSVVDDFPLILMLLVVLSLVAGVLAFDRSQKLFEQRVRTKSETRNMKIIKGIIALIVFLIPLFVNRFFSFEFGIGVSILEIFVLFLLLSAEKEIQTPWTKI